MPAFKGQSRQEHEFLYQNFANKYTALVWGNWKLVNYQELYNLATDRMESSDVSQKMPEKFMQMRAEFRKRDLEMNGGKVLLKTEKGKIPSSGRGR